MANKDLAAGEEVINELPVVVGPKLDTYPLCLGCLAPVDASALCSACGWPVCDAECEKLPMHADAECKVRVRGSSIRRFAGSGSRLTLLPLSGST